MLPRRGQTYGTFITQSLVGGRRPGHCRIFSDVGGGPGDCCGHGAAHRIERVQCLFAAGKFPSVGWAVTQPAGDRSLVFDRRNSGEEQPCIVQEFPRHFRGAMDAPPQNVDASAAALWMSGASAPRNRSPSAWALAPGAWLLAGGFIQLAGHLHSAQSIHILRDSTIE